MVSVSRPLKDEQGNPTENRAIGTIYSIPVMESLRAGKEYRGRAIVVGEWQKTVYVPLKNHAGQVIAGPYVGIPENTFFALRDRFEATLAPVVGACLLFMIVVSLVLGRFLTRMIGRLRLAAERIAQGDLTTTDLGVRSNDELGDLARTFESMTEGMRDLLSSLMRAIDDLLQAVSRIGQVSQKLADSSEKVSAAISRVAQGAQEQNQSVADTLMSQVVV